MQHPKVETTVISHQDVREIRFTLYRPQIGQHYLHDSEICGSAPLTSCDLASLAEDIEQIDRQHPGIVTGEAVPFTSRPRIGRFIRSTIDGALVSEDEEIFRLLLPMWEPDVQADCFRSISVFAVPKVFLVEIRTLADRPLANKSVAQYEAYRVRRTIERRRFRARVKRRRTDADCILFDSLMAEIGALGDRDEASGKHLAHAVAALVAGASWTDAVDYRRPSPDWDPLLNEALVERWAEVDAIRSRVGQRRFTQIARSSEALELFLDDYLAEYWSK